MLRWWHSALWLPLASVAAMRRMPSAIIDELLAKSPDNLSPELDDSFNSSSGSQPEDVASIGAVDNRMSSFPSEGWNNTSDASRPGSADRSNLSKSAELVPSSQNRSTSASVQIQSQRASTQHNFSTASALATSSFNGNTLPVKDGMIVSASVHRDLLKEGRLGLPKDLSRSDAAFRATMPINISISPSPAVFQNVSGSPHSFVNRSRRLTDTVNDSLDAHLGDSNTRHISSAVYIGLWSIAYIGLFVCCVLPLGICFWSSSFRQRVPEMESACTISSADAFVAASQDIEPDSIDGVGSLMIHSFSIPDPPGVGRVSSRHSRWEGCEEDMRRSLTEPSPRSGRANRMPLCHDLKLDNDDDEYSLPSSRPSSCDSSRAPSNGMTRYCVDSCGAKTLDDFAIPKSPRSRLLESYEPSV